MCLLSILETLQYLFRQKVENLTTKKNKQANFFFI